MRLTSCLLVFLLLIQLIGCSSQEKVIENTNEPKIIKNTSPIPNVDIVSEFFEDTQYKYSINYPSIHNHESISVLTTFIDDLKKQAKMDKQTLDVTFHFDYLSEKLTSVIFLISKKMDKKSEAKSVKTFLINLESEQEIRLVDFFKTDIDYEQKLTQILKDNTAIPPQNFSLFSINENGLSIYSGEEHTQVVPSVFVEWNKLKEELSDAFVFKPIRDISQPFLVDNHRLKGAYRTLQTNKTPEKNQKMIAITFDDGPHETITPAILDMLSKYGAKATFFMLGHRAQYYPDIVSRVVKEGHELANHSWDHPQLTKLSVAEMKEQLEKTDSLLESMSGVNVYLIRPPYGAYNETLQANAQGPLINWSVDTLDWKNRNADIIMNTIDGTIDPGDIILMHDIYQSTFEAAERIVKKYTEMGYTFVTVSELLGFNQVKPANGTVYTSKQ